MYTQGQFDAAARVVVAELKTRGETPLVEYLTRPGTGYLVEPWSKWYVGAARFKTDDGNYMCVTSAAPRLGARGLGAKNTVGSKPFKPPL